MITIPVSEQINSLKKSDLSILFFCLLKKYNVHNKSAVISILMKLSPNGCINEPLNKYFTAVKLMAKKIFVPVNAKCAFSLFPIDANSKVIYIKGNYFQVIILRNYASNLPNPCLITFHSFVVQSTTVDGINPPIPPSTTTSTILPNFS